MKSIVMKSIDEVQAEWDEILVKGWMSGRALSATLFDFAITNGRTLEELETEIKRFPKVGQYDQFTLISRYVVCYLPKLNEVICSKSASYAMQWLKSQGKALKASNASTDFRETQKPRKRANDKAAPVIIKGGDEELKTLIDLYCRMAGLYSRSAWHICK